MILPEHTARTLGRVGNILSYCSGPGLEFRLGKLAVLTGTSLNHSRCFINNLKLAHKCFLPHPSRCMHSQSSYAVQKCHEISNPSIKRTHTTLSNCTDMKVATCNMENETGPVDLGDAVYFKGKTLREQTTGWLLVVNSAVTRPSWILSS